MKEADDERRMLRRMLCSALTPKMKEADDEMEADEKEVDDGIVEDEESLGGG